MMMKNIIKMRTLLQSINSKKTLMNPEMMIMSKFKMKKTIQINLNHNKKSF